MAGSILTLECRPVGRKSATEEMIPAGGVLVVAKLDIGIVHGELDFVGGKVIIGWVEKGF